MKEFTISVKKLTDEELMREACEMTFLGTSKQSLLSIYKSEHCAAPYTVLYITLVSRTLDKKKTTGMYSVVMM